jgi:uncharacterized C2H2 Zn-finger protein
LILFFIGLEEDQSREASSIQILWKKKRVVTGDRANAGSILKYSNAVPFRMKRGALQCAYCHICCPNIQELRKHSEIHNKLDLIEKPGIRCYFPIKIDTTDLSCSICTQVMEDLEEFKRHISAIHSKTMDKEFDDGVIPFVLTVNNLKCVHCSVVFQRAQSLLRHMDDHYQNVVCESCGKGFPSRNKLTAHEARHKSGQFKCPKCDLVFPIKSAVKQHLVVKHRPKQVYRCPICAAEQFTSYHSRLMHMDRVHGMKMEYKCKLCPEVFGSGTLRNTHARVVHMGKKKNKSKKKVITVKKEKCE